MFKVSTSILAGSLVALATGAAMAADLPSRVASPPPPIPVFSWTGFYVGANAGVAFDERRQSDIYFPNGSIIGSGGTDGVLDLLGGSSAGFIGGAQIGYNYQFAGSDVVAGVEADAAYLDSHARNGGTTSYVFTPTTPLSYGLAFVPVPGLAPPTIFLAERRDQYLGTVRGRLGYAFERALLYVTGGFAYSDVRIGYTAGAGLEYAFTNNLSAAAEVLYVNLDKSTYTYNPVFDINANTLTVNLRGGRDDFVVARAKLNYKLDFGAPPVVARY